MKAYVNLLAILVILLSYGCTTGEVDLSPPTINEISYTPTPVEDEICGSIEPVVLQLTGGDGLNYNLIFEDDIALSQYKVDIHNNFDCHGHGGGVAPKSIVPTVDSQTEDWTVLDIINISGTSASANQTLNVPESVTAGNYHFHIQVIDEAGNDSPFTNFYALKIKNPIDQIPPVISITTPSESNFSIIKGETIRFTGNVTDDRSLSDGGNGILYLAYTDLSSGNTFNTDIAFPFDENIDTSFDFDFDYTVPLTLINGDYRFSLGANDGVRNVGNFMFFDVVVGN